MLDLTSCVCSRMVKTPLTPKKVTVDLEEEESAHDAGQWTEGLSKGVYVHKVSSRCGVKRSARSPARGKKKRNRPNGNGMFSAINYLLEV